MRWSILLAVAPCRLISPVHPTLSSTSYSLLLKPGHRHWALDPPTAQEGPVDSPTLGCLLCHLEQRPCSRDTEALGSPPIGSRHHNQGGRNGVSCRQHSRPERSPCIAVWFPWSCLSHSFVRIFFHLLTWKEGLSTLSHRM